jgi:hypothetical protein
MPSLAEIREQHPEYNDLDDEALATGLHKKFYADLPEDEFRVKVGLQPKLGGLPVDASPTQYAAQSAEAAQQPEPLDTTSLPTEGIRAQIASMPEQHRAAAMRQWQEGKVKEDKSHLSLSNNPVATGLRQFTRGTVTGSFLDEADAALNSVTHSVTGGKAGVPYDEALEYNRAKNRADDEASGWYGTGAKVAGGIATGGPIMKWLANKAKSRLGKLGLFGVGGGTAGGIYGFGEGEGGLENRLDSAETGAKWGAGLSLALPIAGSGGAFALQKAADVSPFVKSRLPSAFSRSSPDEIADDYLAAKIKRSGETPQSLASDLDEGQYATRLESNSYAALPETIGDTSDTLRRLMGSVYRTGNEAGETVKTHLDTRQRGVDNDYARRDPMGPWGRDKSLEGPQGQAERVEDAFDRSIGLKTEQRSARQADDDIIAQQRQEGDELYELARNTSDDFDLQPAIDAHTLIMQQYKGPFRAQLQKALDLFVDPMNRAWDVNNVRRFDAAKKQLDDMIEASKDQGKATNLTRELTGFKNRLLDKVHEGGRNPNYLKARQTWGSAAENREAIEMGKRALGDAKKDSDVTVEMFNALPEGQQRLFRIGLRDGLRRLFDGKTPGDDVTRVLSKRGTQQLLETVIPRSKDTIRRGKKPPGAHPQARGPLGKDVFHDRPERFGELLRREARMVQTKNKTLGNSETAGRLADDAEMKGDMLARVFASGRSITNLTLEAVGAVLTKIGGMRADVALSLAKKLAESDPVAQRQILQRLQQQMGPSKYAQITKALGQSLGMGVTPLAVESNTTPAKLPRQGR